ncbi:hypothetical protein ADL26_20800, partial [Thermoactinomyces vulgaris]
CCTSSTSPPATWATRPSGPARRSAPSAAGSCPPCCGTSPASAPLPRREASDEPEVAPRALPQPVEGRRRPLLAHVRAVDGVIAHAAGPADLRRPALRHHVPV